MTLGASICGRLSLFPCLYVSEILNRLSQLTAFQVPKLRGQGSGFCAMFPLDLGHWAGNRPWPVCTLLTLLSTELQPHPVSTPTEVTSHPPCA